MTLTCKNDNRVMLTSKLGAVTLRSFPNKYLSQNKNHIQKNSTLLIIIMNKWD